MSLIFSNFKNVSYASKVMLITELLNQYRDLVKYMMKLSGCAKINKSIRNNVIEMVFCGILFLSRNKSLILKPYEIV